jgi:hypothetical protein
MNPRCPKGTRRNKKTGECEKNKEVAPKRSSKSEIKTDTKTKTKKASFIYGKLYYSKAMSKQRKESIYEFVGHNINGVESIRTYLREI